MNKRSILNLPCGCWLIDGCWPGWAGEWDPGCGGIWAPFICGPGPWGIDACCGICEGPCGPCGGKWWPKTDIVFSMPWATIPLWILTCVRLHSHGWWWSHCGLRALRRRYNWTILRASHLLLFGLFHFLITWTSIIDRFFCFFLSQTNFQTWLLYANFFFRFTQKLT